jgi:dephospho-CoA kinase
VELGPNDVAVMEAVNLMEPGYARWCDQTWLVGVDDEIAVQRMIETRGMTEAEARQRLASMRPFEQRAPGADWTYKNNGTMDEMRAAVDAELDRLVELKAQGALPASVFPGWWESYREQYQKASAAAGQKAAE